MAETWVHGDSFIPRLYGPDNLVQVGGIGWTDIQGLKDGHQARFVMRDERKNYFHAIIPVTGTPQLQEVRVEFSSTFPVLEDAWVHQGGNHVADTSSPVVTSVGSMSTFSLAGINQPVSRGLCISLGFTTVGGGIGQGEIVFLAAGAIFA